MTHTKTDIINKIITAYGGYKQWKKADAFKVQISFGGLAFLSRFKNLGQKSRTVYLNFERQSVVFEDYPIKGNFGFYEPHMTKIYDHQFRLLEYRHDPIEVITTFTHRFYWDNLDLLFFAGYALWNYIFIPRLLIENKIAIKSISQDLNQLEKVDVSFSKEITTHSTNQSFYIDNEGFIVRHDYEPLAYFKKAKAANLAKCIIHQDGVNVFSKRYVYPRNNNDKVLSWPLLVWINIHDFEVISKDQQFKLQKIKF